MRYANPYIRKIARGIKFLCAAYFVVFSFLYLYIFQRDLLAQVQFQMSAGDDDVHFLPFWSALLCTSLLWVLGLFISRILHWLPLRLRAATWFLPFLLLTALTHWRFPQFGDSGSLPSVFWIIVILALYFILLLIGRMNLDSTKERGYFSTYAWPNALLLALMTAACVSFSNTDIVLHRTLRAAKQIEVGDYDAVLEMARYEQHPSRQLSAMTAMALSNRGELGDCLFAYPQPHGVEGLLPQLADTALFCNLPLLAGRHLGYMRGARSTVPLFLEAISSRPKAQPSVHDYRVAAALLERNLPEFVNLVQSDTLALTHQHYREALVLQAHLANDSTLAPADSLLRADFVEFQSLLNVDGTKDEREFRCRNRFGATYWTYFYFH